MYKNHKLERYASFFMDVAERTGNLSYANRLKVGSVLVKGENIISFGFNGTPKGFDNQCEDETGKTFDFVLHSEANTLMKAAKGSVSTKGSTLFITHSPCVQCAKLIIQSDLHSVIYRDAYRCDEGIKLIKKARLPIFQLKELFK